MCVRVCLWLYMNVCEIQGGVSTLLQLNSTKPKNVVIMRLGMAPCQTKPYLVIGLIYLNHSDTNINQHKETIGKSSTPSKSNGTVGIVMYCVSMIRNAEGSPTKSIYYGMAKDRSAEVTTY